MDMKSCCSALSIQPRLSICSGKLRTRRLFWIRSDFEKYLGLNRNSILEVCTKTVGCALDMGCCKKSHFRKVLYNSPAENMNSPVLSVLNHNKSAPLLLWLQGGPGLTSMYGLFNEHGPYEIYRDRTAGLRKHSWAQSMHMLYVDNPVGTGFSFTTNDKGYPTNEDEVARDLYEFLRQFFIIFHEYKNNDFYITGESYACKYVPAVAHKIHQIGPSSGINLKGVSVGNGLCEFRTMAYYGNYYFNLGLVDENQAEEMNNVSRAIKKLIRKNEYLKAYQLSDSLLVANDSLAANFTGFHYYYNMLFSESPPVFDYYVSYLQLPKIRRAVHVGNLPFMAEGKESFLHLLEDIMMSQKSEITVLMDYYKFMLYSGQLDLRIPYPLTIHFLKTVKWKYQKEYKTAKRQIWRLAGSGAIAGYVHQVKDFYEVLVRNAGHIVPHDQPESALDLITRFVNDIPFS